MPIGRDIIPIVSSTQTTFDFDTGEETQSVRRKAMRAGTFTDNLSLPVHRWFRYSAGFSAEWVQKLIQCHGLQPEDTVYDPFVGSGTTLLAAQAKNVRSVGIDNHPFVHRIATAKLAWKSADQGVLLESTSALLAAAKLRISKTVPPRDGLLAKCYSPEILTRLIAIRDAYHDNFSGRDSTGKLLWLAITSILRECSGVGTAQWQYVLPKKSKARALEPFGALAARVKMIGADIDAVRRTGALGDAKARLADARCPAGIDALIGQVRLVVTSPPYPNNYDYADATRLEMTFWGEIDGWGDLQYAVRRHLIRSCSQHTAAERLQLEALLDDEALFPIKGELTKVCAELAAIRETKGGRKTYHTMVAAYFGDLARVWRSLRKLCAPDANVYFVIGDSAPYGVHVPAERWLGELALAAGFRSWSFEKMRDRNLKWKNRKHRVPLMEGTLRVET